MVDNNPLLTEPLLQPAQDQDESSADFGLPHTASSDPQKIMESIKEQLSKQRPVTIPDLAFPPKSVCFLEATQEFLVFGAALEFQRRSAQDGRATSAKYSFGHEAKIQKVLALSPDTVVYTNGEVVKKANISDFEPEIVWTGSNIRNIHHAAERLFIWTNSSLVRLGPDRGRNQIDLEEAPKSMAVHPNGKIVAVGFREYIRVIYLENRDQDWSANISNSSALRLSSNLLACATDTSVVVLSLLSHDIERTVQCSSVQRFRRVSIDPDEHLLVAGSRDGTVTVWNLDSPLQLPMIFPGSGSVEKLEWIGHRRLMYFSSVKSKIKILEIPERFWTDHSLEICHGTVKEITCAKNDQTTLFVTLKGNGVLVVDSKKTLDEKDHLLADKDVMVAATFSLVFFMYNQDGQSNFAIYSLAVGELTLQRRVSFNEDSEICGIYPRANHDQVIICFSSGTIALIDRHLAVLDQNDYHSAEITALVSSSEGNWFISVDSTRKLHQVNLDTFALMQVFNPTGPQIEVMALSSQDKFLLCGCIDGTVEEYNTESRQRLSVMKFLAEPITTLAFLSSKNSRDEELFYALIGSRANKVSVWQLKSNTMLCVKSGFHTFSVAADHVHFACSNRVHSTKNPVTNKAFSVFGACEEEAAYLQYISKITRRKSPNYQAAYNYWLITPYCLNVLHFYAFYNLSHHFKQALMDNVLFIEDRWGNSALTIAVEKGSYLMNHLIDFLIRKLRRNRGFSFFLRYCIVQINKLGSVHLSDLYNELFPDLNLALLPQHCSKSIRLPIMKPTEHVHDMKKDFFFDFVEGTHDQPVQYKIFTVKLDQESGSSSSIEFLQSLFDCPNPEVFRTEFITEYILNKWKKAAWVMRAQALLYTVYLLLFIVYLTMDYHNLSLLSLFSVSVVIFLYELFQMLVTGRAYFKDPINYIDILQHSFVFIYVGLELMYEYTEAREILLIFICVSSFIRGITYFKIFSPTRYMIYLLVEVFKDIGSFLVLLGYSVLALTAMYMCIDFERTKGNFFDYLTSAYIISLGDAENSFDLAGEGYLLLLASFINTIIMLNLLISILGDTFDRVQQGRVEADLRGIAEMVIEVELLLFWKRNRSKLEYITLCKLDNVVQTNTGTWEGKLRALMNKVDSVKNRFEQSNEELRRDIRHQLQELRQLILSNPQRA